MYPDEVLPPLYKDSDPSREVIISRKVQTIGMMVKKLHKKLGKKSTLVTRHATIIDSLPDDVLLQIFNFCGGARSSLQVPFYPVLGRRRLRHVCRRWRRIVLSSPHCLDLYVLSMISSSNDKEDMIATLGHLHRVCSLRFPVTSSLLGEVTTVAPVQAPFLILGLLAQLWLSSQCGAVSAPRFGEIHFNGNIFRTSFQTLPVFLSYASDIVYLYLYGISHIGYCSPEVMATSLVALTRLESLDIGFHPSTARPNQSCSSGGRVALPTRAVLPALTSFAFYGASEYLEDLVAQIDAPHLTTIHIKYFNQLDFHWQELQIFRFIGQTQIIGCRACATCARVYFCHPHVEMTFSSGPEGVGPVFLHLEIPGQGLDWQVSHMAKALSQSSMVLSNVRYLILHSWHPKSSWQDDMDHLQWLALLRQFAHVETLHVHHLAGHIADALKHVTFEMAPEILPALRLLDFVDEPATHADEFNNARRLSGHSLPPVIITHTSFDLRRPHL